MKRLLSIIAGVVVGGIVVGIVESVGHLIWPPPPGLDITNPDDLARLMESIPAGALVFVVLGWTLGAIAGGFTAGKISEDPTYLPSIFAGGILMTLGIVTLFMIPHPVWMWIMGIVLPVPCAWWGGRWAGVKE
ncbi:MAG: hypothetical protein O2797_03910 [Bacteroidetes bacterium]|nr:hypothetical protein [Bacteroidota bacterium]MDA1333348.1 hypothetical protein [Bacteroidota bacterium]